MAEQKGSRELVVALFPGAAADVPLTLLLVVDLEEHVADGPQVRRGHEGQKNDVDRIEPCNRNAIP